MAAPLPFASSRTVRAASLPSTADMMGGVIYQIVTDRFYDGDPSNDNPSSSPNLYSVDKSDWYYYWGGDWKGIADEIPYLANMGVTAIWISPPVENVNVPVVINGGNQAGYHGYWGMDFYVPEPHFGTWTDFDNMVQTAHANGIHVIMDFAPNHTNPCDPNNPSYAKDGALYQNGTEVSEYDNDPNGYFHHNGTISNYEDLYQVEYENMANLADLAQENSLVDQYLRGAVDTWLSHGVDGIRMDAVKLIPGGWLKAFDDHIYAEESVFLFGEWYDGSSATLWPDEVKFANTAGMSLENFDLNGAIRDVFASGGSMTELDNAISRDETDFAYQNQLVNFVDNQDIPRLLSVDNNTTLLDEATVFTMTAPGIPSIYYGDEQYLHNDTNGGADPYNRPMMSSWSESTRDYQIIQKLSQLRATNPALRYGVPQQRWLNSDVYIFERKFFNYVVLTAINKSTTTGYNITGLYTALPTGTYSDVLGGLLGGGSITVSSGSGGNNPVTAFTLGPNQAAVWSYVAPTPGSPEVGNIDPVMGRTGNVVAVTGQGFGSSQGSVSVGGANATIISWSNTEVDFQVPSGAPAGTDQVAVTTGGGTSNSIQYNVLSGPQVAVTFRVDNAYPTNPGDEIYLTGNVPELGNWSTNASVAVGRLLDPNNPTWFGMASVPANTNLQFKFIDIQSNGNVIWENGSNHTYTSPSSGDGSVEVSWQY
jgi:glycosidase